MTEPVEKSYEEHRHYLHEIVKLKLWFVWNWLHRHPEESFVTVLRERVDIYRKSAINPDHLNPRQLHFDSPRWLELEAQAQRLYEQCREDADASRFERLAFAVFQPTVDARSRRDYQEECDGAYRRGYQCGSLRYEVPREAAPTVIPFHIANAARPRSLFDDPGYLPACFRQLMDECEAQYGADTLSTGTWLNTHPKWLALFPPEWHANLGPVNRDVKWHYGFWGQFLTGRGTFNARYGEILRRTGEFPHYLRASRCSFAAMRAHLDEHFPAPR